MAGKKCIGCQEKPARFTGDLCRDCFRTVNWGRFHT